MGINDLTVSDVKSQALSVFGFTWTDAQAKECIQRLKRLKLGANDLDEEKLVQNINGCYRAVEANLPIPPEIV
jgi:hypothetical protein